MRQAENLATGQDMQGQPVNIQDGMRDGMKWDGTDFDRLSSLVP